VAGVITQNVDRLHHVAGSRCVIELHGALADVVCLKCGTHEHRRDLQRRLEALNGDWSVRDVDLAPDGDAEFDGGGLDKFQIATCRACAGTLKPDVVFFGENVPKKRVEAAFELLGCGEVLLVVGSSLTVYSGFRFVRRAIEQNVPIAIVNIGPTRGDSFATVRVDAAAGIVMTALLDALR
jgi:NAD-dependent SIR2 family protein deacetylase